MCYNNKAFCVAAIAQLVERVIGNDEVGSSNLPSSSNVAAVLPSATLFFWERTCFLPRSLYNGSVEIYILFKKGLVAVQETANERTGAIEINVFKLLGEYLRYWWLIVLAAAVVGGATLLYTVRYITPMYRADISIYVNSYRAGQQVEAVSGTGLSTAEDLVSTYREIAKSKLVLSAVSKELGGQYSVPALRGMVSTSQVANTSVFHVYVSNENPVTAAAIANAFGAVLPDEIGLIVEGSSSFVIDYAEAPSAPYTPNRTRNTMLGALAGAAIVIAFLTLRFLFDIRIWDADDLAQISHGDLGKELPILAQIPDFDVEQQRPLTSYAYSETRGKENA